MGYKGLIAYLPYLTDCCNDNNNNNYYYYYYKYSCKQQLQDQAQRQRHVKSNWKYIW